MELIIGSNNNSTGARCVLLVFVDSVVLWHAVDGIGTSEFIDVSTMEALGSEAAKPEREVTSSDAKPKSSDNPRGNDVCRGVSNCVDTEPEFKLTDDALPVKEDSGLEERWCEAWNRTVQDEGYFPELEDGGGGFLRELALACDCVTRRRLCVSALVDLGFGVLSIMDEKGDGWLT